MSARTIHGAAGLKEVVGEHLGYSDWMEITQERVNKFAEAKSEPRWHAFIRQYRDPMQIVLLVAGLGSIWPVHELGTGLVIIFLTLFNAVLGLRQEGKAAEAVAALQKMMIVKARVLRDGALTQVPAEQLVPGDVVSIEAGDGIPADCRLLSAATLEIAESALTGESVPVSKGTDPIAAEDAPLGDRSDMVYMNTNATRGAGEFVVTSTGMATEVGHISNLLQAEGDAKTPLTRQLEKLTGQILFIAGAAGFTLFRYIPIGMPKEIAARLLSALGFALGLAWAALLQRLTKNESRMMKLE